MTEKNTNLPRPSVAPIGYKEYGSAVDAAAVTKSDSTTFNPLFRGLYVGTTGDVAVRMASGAVVTFSAVAASAILPIIGDRVMSTNTTASNIVALF